MADISKIKTLDGTTYDIKDTTARNSIPTNISDLINDAGFITGMEILSYGKSTWNDFLTAYNAKKVVYCRASSNSNPASGSQTRLAFMAYISNAENPTFVEFQYYRSVSSHTDAQQGDQVYVYTLASSGTWTVTVREASTKILAGTNLTSSYTNGTLTLNATGGGGMTLTAGDGLDITNDVIKNTQGIEYIVGTQTASTAAWTGVSTDETLQVGKIIAYYLPYAGTSTEATLTLTMADGSTTEAIPLRRQSTSTVTTQFAASNVIILIYTGNYWRVSAFYDTTTNTVPTGYCTSAAATVAKSATCSYGYRGDTNYFPCLFRHANTAANATLSISSYATTALPIYVNGARTSSTNTFGPGVVLFLFYNDAYYCYNDGRLPILVNGTVTSVQEYVETKYTKPSGGIPASDLASAVQTSLGKADTALQAVPSTYRTAVAQDAIDIGMAKTNEVGIVITGARPSITVTPGQYVIVHNSTINGISDGLYTTYNTLSPSVDVTAADLHAIGDGGLNSLLSRLYYPIWSDMALLYFSNMQALVDAISPIPTFGFMMAVFTGDLKTDLFNSPPSYGGIIIIYKASANNAYYLAFSREAAAVGNISITDVSVTMKSGLVSEQRSVTYTYTINAGSRVNTNLYNLINADMPTGAVFESITGFQSGDASTIISAAFYSNTDYSLCINNISSSKVSNKTATIYYRCH